MDVKNLPWYGQLIVFIFIGAIFFGIYYFVYYSPNQDELNRIVAESEKYLADIKKAEFNQDKLKRLKEEKKRNEAILEDLKGILPEKREGNQILRKIQAVVSNARLKMISFTPQNESQREIYIEWPILITVNGTYHNLGIFFDQLSRLKKIFNIDSLSISPYSQMTADRTINASFKTITYFYNESVQPAAGKKPAPRPRPAAPNEKIAGEDQV